MSIHDGHRQRMKKRFRQEGLESFSEVNVLELMLFYAIPRQDSNPLAHELLKRYGTLAKVLEAPAEELMKVPGVGENVATFLSLFNEVERYLLVADTQKDIILHNTQECGKYLAVRFHKLRNETVFLLCLDAKRKVLCCREIGEGSVNSASISIRRVVETAINANATTVVLAHNHPSGIAVPSAEDVQTTIRVAKALGAVEIILADHIIVAEGDYVSLAASGMYDPRDYLFD